MNWTLTTQQLPPDGEVVETKVDYGDIVDLVRNGDKWYHPVLNLPTNFTPTHWRRNDYTG